MTSTDTTIPGFDLDGKAPAYAIEVKGLTKIYDRGTGARSRDLTPALDDFSLSIERGSIFGLLGPNGAGKSTFINILAGLVVKSAGAVRIWDIDIDRNHRQAKACIGVVPQELNLDPFFTPYQLLDLHAGLYAIARHQRRTKELLRTVGLIDKQSSYARTLSGGMRRRLMIAKAMVHSPPILVLDEPTAGVDVGLRHYLWQQIRTWNRSGVTILLTTHYLEEAENLCDRIAIIDQGKVKANDTTKALLSRIDQKELLVRMDGDIASLDDFAGKPYHVEKSSDHGIVVRYCPRVTRIADVLKDLSLLKVSILDVTTRQADLEDVFLRLTNPSPDQRPR